MLRELRYDLPAREPDEELADNWSFKLRSSLVQGGLENVSEETANSYEDVLESGIDWDTASYNLGISAAKTYEDINIDEKEWMQSISDGLAASEISTDFDLGKARDLLYQGFDDRESLADEGYNV